MIAVGLYKKPAPRALAYLGPESTYVQLSSSLTWNNMKGIRNRFKGFHSTKTFSLVITPTSQILVPVLAFSLPKTKLILDLGWPISDQVGTTRTTRDKIKRVKNFIVDFIAMQLSDAVIVETNAQVERIRRKFWLNEKKIRRIYTSLDETTWKVYPKPISAIEPLLHKSSKIIVLFRGKYNKESGIEKIFELAAGLEDRFQVIIATDRLPNHQSFRPNIVVLEQFFEYSELVYLYSIADLCLGQLSADNRTAYTLPHKYVESGFFGKPYVSFECVPLQEAGLNGGLIAIKDLASVSEILKHETKSTLLAKGRLNKKYYEQHLSQESVVAAMEKLIKQVV